MYGIKENQEHYKNTKQTKDKAIQKVVELKVKQAQKQHKAIEEDMFEL